MRHGQSVVYRTIVRASRLLEVAVPEGETKQGVTSLPAVPERGVTQDPPTSVNPTRDGQVDSFSRRLSLSSQDKVKATRSGGEEPFANLRRAQFHVFLRHCLLAQSRGSERISSVRIGAYPYNLSRAEAPYERERLIDDGSTPAPAGTSAIRDHNIVPGVSDLVPLEADVLERLVPTAPRGLYAIRAA